MVLKTYIVIFNISDAHNEQISHKAYVYIYTHTRWGRVRVDGNKEHKRDRILMNFKLFKNSELSSYRSPAILRGLAGIFVICL